jgi:medium-chain acyl-[acyl-carrier-protein] hydrolase
MTERLAQPYMDIHCIHTSNYRVHSYEADLSGMVRFVTLLNYLQDAASSHAASQGLSISHLMEKNATWLLLRYHIKVMKYPRVGEDLLVRTWRSKLQGYHALREFEILDGSRTVIGIASSTWIVMNLESRRPVRLDSFMTGFQTFPHCVLQDESWQLRKLDACDREVSFRVKMGDIDLNHHVNHRVYVDWAIESVPERILMDFVPVECQIAYRSEARLGDQVICRSSAIDNSDVPAYVHQQSRVGDGKELTRIKTVWRDRNNP